MDTYANGTEELTENAIEAIDSYISALSLEIDNETILDNIQKLDIYNLEERELENTKQLLLINVNIPKLEQTIKEVVLNLSNIGQSLPTTDISYIALDNQARLELIYKLLSNIETFKTQTRNIKRNRINCKNNYEYILSYLLQAQDLIKSIYQYANFKQMEIVETYNQEQ